MFLDRKGILKDIKSMEGRGEKSTISAYQSNGDGLLVSYANKRRQARKFCRAYFCQCFKESTCQAKCPCFLWSYQRRGRCGGSNTTKIKKRRWPINALAFISNTVLTKPKTILAESPNPATPSSFEFIYTLGKLLVLPHMQRRYQDSSNFFTVLVHKCDEFWVFK